MAQEKLEFKTEVKQILDIVINSLYTNREIFMRELISNASDAIDRARYEALTERSILEGKEEEEWKIKLIPDKDKGTLTIRDNGIGLSKEEAITELGTIAHSGTKTFLEALKESKDGKAGLELIGQFGVGFYSAYMVSDKVTVISRKGGEEKGVKWESTADGTFTVEEIEKDHRGTDVILHLREDEKKYLQEWELRTIVRKYSDYIEHPVLMDVERDKEDEKDKDKRVKVTEEETLNSRKAIWLKKKSDITDEEYEDFYKHLSRDFSPPLKRIHYKAEGTSEFTTLLYIPSRMPFDILYKDFKFGPTLYIKRVQIMDHCEMLLPQYLRFIKGVVDSSDLPLNISRETLQNNSQVEVIKKNLTKKILDNLKEMKEKEYEEYLKFHKEFGRILKEGIHYDYSKKEDIASLLLFDSTKAEEGKFRTLEDYMKDMKEGQEEIYYITGEGREEVINSPYLEAFKEKDYEVLIMVDEIDDIIMGSLNEFKGKKFKSAIKGDIELDKGEKEKKEEEKKKYGKLMDLVKEHLKEDIKDARLSNRLTGSPCCLVVDEGAMDASMEKLMKAMGQAVPESKKILEVNPSHPVIETMNKIFEKDSEDKILKEYIELIYNQALILEGSKLKEPVKFAGLVSRLMVENVK